MACYPAPYDYTGPAGSGNQLESALSKGNVLVFMDPGSEMGEKLVAQVAGGNSMAGRLKSHQYGAVDLIKGRCFYLENGDRKLFVVSSPDEEVAQCNSGSKLRMQARSSENMICTKAGSGQKPC